MRQEAGCRRIPKWNRWKKFARRCSIRSAQMRLKNGAAMKRSGRKSSSSGNLGQSRLTVARFEISLPHLFLTNFGLAVCWSEYMSTIALPRSFKTAMPQLRDPALLVPLVGAGVLIYLAVLPLFMLAQRKL